MDYLNFINEKYINLGGKDTQTLPKKP